MLRKCLGRFIYSGLQKLLLVDSVDVETNHEENKEENLVFDSISFIRGFHKDFVSEVNIKYVIFDMKMK